MRDVSQNIDFGKQKLRGVANIEIGEQIMRDVSQKSRSETNICERCHKNEARETWHQDIVPLEGSDITRISCWARWEEKKLLDMLGDVALPEMQMAATRSAAHRK